MIKRIAVAALLIAVAAAASAEDIRGAWTADATDGVAGSLHMQLNRRHNNFGTTMNLSAFEGLSQAQVNAAAQTPVHFAMRREAGTVDFEGTFKAGLGAGQFAFTANPAYLETVRNLGVSVEAKKTRHLGKPAEERLMMLALNDVSTNYIRSMMAEGYRVSLDEYLSFRIFDVTPELVRELRQLGYRDIPADELVESQIHRVTPAFIRSMASAGFRDLPLKDLKEAGIHGVTPEFINQIRAAGYADLELKRLVEFRIHRVTPEYIAGLRDAGYANIPARKLVEMKIHRVTPEFIQELADAGYRNIPVQKLIEMKIHGVDAEFVKKMNKM
jgi:hypothetical protein